MLNPQELNPAFVSALEKSWDKAAIWPGCVQYYIEGVSHPSFGQCFVGSLAAWKAHGGAAGPFALVPGTVYGDALPEDGILHFQLHKTTALPRIPVDLTWDQFPPGAEFVPTAPKSELFYEETSDSLADPSLATRLSVIFKNLAANGIDLDATPEDTIAEAQHYFDSQCPVAFLRRMPIFPSMWFINEPGQ